MCTSIKLSNSHGGECMWPEGCLSKSTTSRAPPRPSGVCAVDSGVERRVAHALRCDARCKDTCRQAREGQSVKHAVGQQVAGVAAAAPAWCYACVSRTPPTRQVPLHRGAANTGQHAWRQTSSCDPSCAIPLLLPLCFARTAAVLAAQRAARRQRALVQRLACMAAAKRNEASAAARTLALNVAIARRRAQR